MPNTESEIKLTESASRFYDTLALSWGKFATFILEHDGQRTNLINASCPTISFKDFTSNFSVELNNDSNNQYDLDLFLAYLDVNFTQAPDLILSLLDTDTTELTQQLPTNSAWSDIDSIPIELLGEALEIKRKEYRDLLESKGYIRISLGVKVKTTEKANEKYKIEMIESNVAITRVNIDLLRRVKNPYKWMGGITNINMPGKHVPCPSTAHEQIIKAQVLGEHNTIVSRNNHNDKGKARLDEDSQPDAIGSKSQQQYDIFGIPAILDSSRFLYTEEISMAATVAVCDTTAKTIFLNANLDTVRYVDAKRKAEFVKEEESPIVSTREESGNLSQLTTIELEKKNYSAAIDLYVKHLELWRNREIAEYYTGEVWRKLNNAYQQVGGKVVSLQKAWDDLPDQSVQLNTFLTAHFAVALSNAANNKMNNQIDRKNNRLIALNLFASLAINTELFTQLKPSSSNHWATNIIATFQKMFKTDISHFSFFRKTSDIDLLTYYAYGMRDKEQLLNLTPRWAVTRVLNKIADSYKKYEQELEAPHPSRKFLDSIGIIKLDTSSPTPSSGK